MISQVDAVVLAGGGALKADSGASKQTALTVGMTNKALLRIGPRLMVDYVIEALKACPEIRRIVLVGPAALQNVYGPDSGLLLARPGDTPLGSLASGAAVLDADPDDQDWVLSCTGDIPFLTAGAVTDFIDQCRHKEADFYYPITSRQAVESRFPGVKRTYVKLRDGLFTGGNLFLVRRSIMKDALPKAEGFMCLRKQPVAMARLVGFGFLFTYLFGLMTIAKAERWVSKLVNYQGAAVISDYAEIGVDVDKTTDLDLARRLLAPKGDQPDSNIIG